MTDEIKQLIQEVGQAAVASAPEHWTSIKLIRKRISTYGEFSSLFYVQSSEEPIQKGINDKHSPAGKRTHNKLDDLRQLMYNQDPALGAWYTCTMIISSDGDFDMKFDYDNQPEWDIQPTEEELALDFRQFPRIGSTIPEWIKPILHKFSGKYPIAL